MSPVCKWISSNLTPSSTIARDNNDITHFLSAKPTKPLMSVRFFQFFSEFCRKSKSKFTPRARGVENSMHCTRQFIVVDSCCVMSRCLVHWPLECRIVALRYARSLCQTRPTTVTSLSQAVAYRTTLAFTCVYNSMGAIQRVARFRLRHRRKKTLQKKF